MAANPHNDQAPYPKYGQTAGSTFGQLMGGPVGAAMGSAAGSILDNAFGSKNVYATGQYKRGIREQKKNALWEQENISGRNLQGLVKDAQAAGLHPLFALGAAGVPAKLSTDSSAGIAGQSKSGSHATDAIRALVLANEREKDRNANLELVKQQNQAAMLRLVYELTSNDKAQAAPAAAAAAAAARIPGQESVNPHYEEFKKGEVMARDPAGRETNAGSRGIFNKFRIGRQDVWLPTEEISEFMENPALMGGMAYNSHLNKHVNWTTLFNDYRYGIGWAKIPPKQRKQYLPKSSAPYRSRYPSHHGR